MVAIAMDPFLSMGSARLCVLPKVSFLVQIVRYLLFVTPNMIYLFLLRLFLPLLSSFCFYALVEACRCSDIFYF